MKPTLKQTMWMLFALVAGVMVSTQAFGQNYQRNWNYRGGYQPQHRKAWNHYYQNRGGRYYHGPTQKWSGHAKSFNKNYHNFKQQKYRNAGHRYGTTRTSIEATSSTVKSIRQNELR